MSDENTTAAPAKPVATTAERVAGICRDTPAVIRRTLQDVRTHGTPTQHGKILRELESTLLEHKTKQIDDAVELLKEIAPDRLALGDAVADPAATPIARVAR